MDPDTFRSDIGVDVYWRRRMVALLGVLMVVALVAWACSAGGQDDDPRANGTATGSPSPDPVLALLPAVTITPTPPSPRSPEATPSPKAAVVKAKPKVQIRRPGQTCDPSDLVLDIRGRSEVYPGGSRPQFIVTLVNTNKVMCTADVGARALEVRITSGDDRIWSSADCVSGEAEEIRRLDRGIPYVRQIDWNRHRSGSDCSAHRPAAKAGTYVAMVRTPDLKSHKAVFHLR
ncbi:hypothetical protein ABZ470_10995 [Streptosporangium sp. NPDC020072]|uniref:hypothetical protein n=1 Tax=Streptosporangium sp. NPDC020072 TaxID=3154788 RepID=UPI0034155562